MKYEVRIPAEKMSDDNFAVLAAQLRIFLGVPSEALPYSSRDLYIQLEARGTSRYPFRVWLRENGYEVVRAPTFELGPAPYHVIRCADPEELMWKSMGDRILADIDRHVLHALSSEVK